MRDVAKRMEKEAMEQNEATAPYRRRRELIRQIEELRKSKVITYVLSDRVGLSAQIADDAVRPMFDHLRGVGSSEQIDLFLYSTGGMTDAPWRFITMLREFASRLSVLVPYKAMSAATMIALGADSIVMGRKGELGPIDPQFQVRRGEGETVVQDQIGVEDVMAYIKFVQEHVKVTDQVELAKLAIELGRHVPPPALGSVYRAHSHIRDVAKKLLSVRHPDHAFPTDQIEEVVQVLAERVFQHGHAIGRSEASKMGLNIERAEEPLEDALWSLYEEYETSLDLLEPFDIRKFLPPGVEEKEETVQMGAVESVGMAHHFTGQFSARVKREIPSQVPINISANITLPPNIPAEALPAAVQQVLQQHLQQFQNDAAGIVSAQVQAAMPIIGVDGELRGGRWRRFSDWPTDD